MKFKKLRNLLEHGRSIQICLTSTGGDIAGTYEYVDDIPNTYDNMPVIGIGVTHVERTLHDKMSLVPAFEIYLDSIKHRKKEISKKKKGDLK